MLKDMFFPKRPEKAELDVFGKLNDTIAEGETLKDAEWRKIIVRTYVALYEHERHCQIKSVAQNWILLGIFVLLFFKRLPEIIAWLGRVFY